MTYLPFDIETALKNPELVIARNGKKISEIYRFNTAYNTEYNIHFIIEGEVECCNNNGLYFNIEEESPLDLFLLPDYKERFVNVYTNHYNDLYVGGLFDTLEIAKSAIKTRLSECRIGYSYLKTIKITSLPYEPNCNQKETL